MDIDQIRHTAGVLGLASLDPQEATFVQHLLRGVPLMPAAKASGIKPAKIPEVQARPHVAGTLAYLRDLYMASHVEVNRDMLNMMLMESHAKAATATEEIMAIRELGKMNGCYEPEKREVSINAEVTYEKVCEMDTDELVRLAGSDDLEPDAEDAEFEEVQ